MTDTPQHPDLEERFLEPPGWRWNQLKRDGRTMRFGYVFPDSACPDALIICLPGLSEYGEKYFETARDMLGKNYAFWVFDWMGQGLSDRYIQGTHKRHSAGFQHDVDDLHAFITNHVDAHPDAQNVPLVMLAHSMGANIGLHYLRQHPGTFKCAAFSAPMIGIQALSQLPGFLQITISKIAKWLASNAYVTGGHDWSEDSRAAPGADGFSSDPVRGALHKAWCIFNKDLQIGHVTYGWVYEAIKSCRALQEPELLRAIQTPCLIASAGQDTLVDNKAIERAASLMPNARLLDLPTSNHEILMEKDVIRDQFLSSFYILIKETIIDRPETLKPRS